MRGRDYTEKLAAGELITASFRELAEARREILIYLGVFLLVDLAASWLPFAQWLLFGGYFLGQYLLYRSMLRRAGHRADGPIRIFRFFATAFMIALALLFASYLFVVPAILLAARWIVAPCYIVAAGSGPFGSIGASWSATSGNTLPLSLAFVTLVLVFIVVAMVFGVLGEAFERLLGTDWSYGFVFHVLPLLLMGLSLAAYRRLNREGSELAAVFA